MCFYCSSAQYPCKLPAEDLFVVQLQVQSSGKWTGLAHLIKNQKISSSYLKSEIWKQFLYFYLENEISKKSIVFA